jgi:hypothetical protein
MSKEQSIVQDYSKWDASALKQRILDNVSSMLPESAPERSMVLQNIDALNPVDANLNELKKATIVTDIVQHIVHDHAVEVMKGAHIMIDDGGDLYDQLVSAEVVSTRVSSHHKNNKKASDVSLQAGEIFREFLVGKTEDGKTWFQIEAHSATTSVSVTTIPKVIKDLILHLVDFIQYKWTGKNVGQYGLSEHTDQNPITASYKKEQELNKATQEAAAAFNVYKVEGTGADARTAINKDQTVNENRKWRDL